MATPTLEPELRLAPAVRSLLGSLRLWILAYIWVEGLAVAAAWLGVAFWGSLAIDWFFEPPPWIRGVMLGGVGLVLVGVLVQLIGRRTCAPLANSNMAMVLERRFPHLNDSLLTAVALTGRSPDPAECNRQMLAHTCREAAERVEGVDLRRVFNPYPLGRSLAASVLLGISVALFALLFPEAFGIWANRCLGFSPDLWPRKARLIVEGFDDGVEKVARGADLEIIAKADTRKEVPQNVRVRYRIEGGRRDRKSMERLGTADPAKDRFQEYSYTFQGILAPIRFDVIGEVKMGRDVSVRDLRIEVVESPTIDEATLRCEFPEYTKRPPRTLPVTGVMRVPEGTNVTVHAKGNKDLVHVQVDSLRGEAASTSHVLVSRKALVGQYLNDVDRIVKARDREASELAGEIRQLVEKMTADGEHKWLSQAELEPLGRLSQAADALAADQDARRRAEAREALEYTKGRLDDSFQKLPRNAPNKFAYRAGSLAEDTSLTFTLFDTDRIKSREPWQLTLSTIADTPPQLAVRLNGIGPAITSEARLPAVGRVTDDYGIAKVWFEYTIDQEKPATHAVSAPPKQPTELKLSDAALDVRELKLNPGQKLLVGLKAEDLYDLAEGPNVGASERWLLDIVTPEQLRAMLEARELVLRQRFEVIIQEVTETRDLLLRIDFGTPDAEGKTAEAPDPGRIEDGSEPGDEPGDEPEQFSPERQSALRVLRVQRALTNASKNAHETQGVADAFDDIRLQLVNNRIDTEELIRRLEEGIANPLHRIAQEMFPVLQLRLEQLQEKLDDEGLGPEQRDLARRQADAILLEMRKVLDRMIELEDFNQAVELLRTIIKLQEALGDQTKQRHKQRIRELLEDEG